MTQSLIEDSSLTKTVEGVCPRCGETVAMVVSEYKAVVRAWKHRTFFCEKCQVEFTVPLQQAHFSVASAAD
jgi:hypothetical protein